jgi:hypothetical protein
VGSQRLTAELRHGQGSVDENKFKKSLQFFLLLEVEIQGLFIQLKPILGIFLRGFSPSSCPRHSLKVLLLLKAMCLFEVFTQL